MTLKKINQDHYVVVTDEPIKEGDYIINIQRNHIYPSSVSVEDVEYRNIKSDVFKKITHSTQRLNTNEVGTDGFEFDQNSTYPPTNVLPLDLSNIKSLVGEVDVEQKSEEWIDKNSDKWSNNNGEVGDNYGSFKAGYNQCLEDNKDKRFTEKDLRKAFNMARKHIELGINKVSRAYSYTEDEAISILTQPKDTWDVEFIDGQLKLK